MRGLKVAVGVGLAAALAGCTADDVRNGMGAACKYLPAEQAVVTLGSLLFPAAGAIYSATQTQTMVEAGCKAVTSAKATKGFASPASIAVRVQGPDGRLVSVPLMGNFVQ